MGPQFRRTTVFVANTTRQPLQEAPAWQHRIPATDAIMEYVIISTVAVTEFEITSGSEILVQRGPIPGAGVAGTYPPFQESKGSVLVYAGQEIAVTAFEIGGAAATVMLEVHLTPV